MQERMQELIGQFKEQHRQVFATIIGDDIYIWRCLGRAEYRRIAQAATSEHDLQERICQAAVLWPEERVFSQYLAGVPGALAPEIKEESGYGSPDKAYAVLDQYRQEMAAFEYQAEVTIATAFPNLTFSQMAEWTIDELMWHLVRAEWALQQIHQKPVEFRPQLSEEEASEPAPAAQAASLREQGIDPMTTLDPESFRPPFVRLPFIGGTKWQDEVIVDGVRQQVQNRLSHPGTRRGA